MAEKKKKITFEEALAGLERSAEVLKKDGTTLEAAMESFEQGIGYYNYCSEILNDAKQKIEFFAKKGSSKEMIPDAEQGISKV